MPPEPATEPARAAAGNVVGLSQAAVVLFAIGSSRCEGPLRSLERHARALAGRQIFRCVRTAVLLGGTPPQRALADLRGDVFVVPMMMCTGWIWSTQIPQALGLAGDDAGVVRTVHLCDPLGHRPELARLIGRRASEAARRHRLDPDRTTLLLFAHGTNRDEGSQRATDGQAARLRALGTFSGVRTGYLDQAPTIAQTVGALEGPAIAAGLFATPGPHAEKDVPRLIGEGRSPFPVHYLGPVGADDGIPEVVLNIVADGAQRRPATGASAAA